MEISIEEAKTLYQGGFKDIAKRAYPNFDFEKNYSTITNVEDFFRYFGYSNECARVSEVLSLGNYSKSAEAFAICALAHKAITCGDNMFSSQGYIYTPNFSVCPVKYGTNQLVGKIITSHKEEYFIKYYITEDINDRFNTDFLFSFNSQAKCEHFMKYFGKKLFDSKFADITEYKWYEEGKY